MHTVLCRLIGIWKHVHNTLYTVEKKGGVCGEFVFCCQNCPDLLWEKIVIMIKKNFWKFKAKGWELANLLVFLEQKNFLTCYWSLVQKNWRIRTNNWDVENYRNKLENIKCDIVCRRVSTMWLQLYIPEISDKAHWSFCGIFVQKW